MATLFAKRFPHIQQLLQQAVYDNRITSFITSSCGGQVIVKFDFCKLIFLLPAGYPTTKLFGYFMNDVPNHPGYAKYTTDVNITTMFPNVDNNILSYIDAVRQSLTSDVNIITHKMCQMKI